jgi:hypothetical protein
LCCFGRPSQSGRATLWRAINLYAKDTDESLIARPLLGSFNLKQAAMNVTEMRAWPALGKNYADMI